MNTGDPENLVRTGAREQLSACRRLFLRLSAPGVGGLKYAGRAREPYLSSAGCCRPTAPSRPPDRAGDILFYTEVFPISPLILTPFSDQLPVPKALRPSADFSTWAEPPGPGRGPAELASATSGTRSGPAIGDARPARLQDRPAGPAARLHHLRGAAIDKNGRATSPSTPASQYAAGTKRTLPPSTIYGFNGPFPGPMINAEYGRPALVRFDNHLDENP